MASQPVNVLDGIYVFAFRPDDNFSGVKIMNPGGRTITGEQLEELKTNPQAIKELARHPNGWHLSSHRSFVGPYAARFAGQGGTITGWLFSCAFYFEAGRDYEAAIYYCGDDTSTLKGAGAGVIPPHPMNQQRLQLRLGKSQTPEAMTQDIFEVGVSGPEPQVAKGVFSVPETGSYHFSLQGHTTGLGAISVLMNSGSPRGALADF